MKSTTDTAVKGIWQFGGERRQPAHAGVRAILLALSLSCGGTLVPEEAMAQVCPGCEVDLVTMFPGDGLFTGFGHIAFRVRNPLTGDDDVYDYGTYDAQDPLIGWHFLTGQLKYYCSHTTWERMLAWYSEDFGGIESRGLVLNEKQIDMLVAQVRVDCLPENAAYAYHHFFNNCSTKIRDLLDRVLEGQLTRAMKGQPAQRSLRELIDASMSRPAFAPSRWIVYGLLNGSIDATADRWDQSFLPYYLTAELDGMTVPDGRPFVKNVELASGAKQGEPPDPPMWPGAMVLVALLIFGAVPMGLARWVGLRGSRVFAGMWMGAMGLFGGFYGLVLVFSWAVSPYPETKWNWTLTCFHPIHLALLVLGVGVALGRTWALVWGYRYLVVWGGTSALLAAFSGGGVIEQRIWHYALTGLAVSVPLVVWLHVWEKVSWRKS